jgi:hypothetical protein
VLSVVVVPPEVPERVTVAADPVTLPEMVYVLVVGGGVAVSAVKMTSTQ